MLDRALSGLALVSSALACSSGQIETSDSGADGKPSAPYLVAFSVTSSGPATLPDGGPATPLELVPPFASDVFDYYLECIAGANAVTVSMTASAGASSSLAKPQTSASLPQQTLSLSVTENQAIVATATAGSAKTEYWVRCLPYDFPRMTMITHAGAGTAPPGYYLVGASLPKTGSRWGYAIVLNSVGVPVWYVHGANRQGVENVDTQEHEAISFVPNLEPVGYEMHNLSPAVKTTIARPEGGLEIDTHELRVLRNGNWLVISSPTKTGVDLTGVNLRLPDGGVQKFGLNSNIIDCHLIEFEPDTGKVVWNWDATDHFDPVKDSTIPTNDHRPGPDGQAVVDMFHCNSIDIDPANGNLLVSGREMDSIFYIERKTGKVLWKMGGAEYTKDHATYVHVEDPFYRQHDARLQPGWSSTCAGGKGQISVFDDHSYVKGSARGVVYDVVVGAADAGDGGDGADCGAGDAAPGATVAWQYAGSGHSEDRGSFRISADGSRVIDWGTGTTHDLVFTEVDSKGHDLVDFYFTDGDVSYRAVKVPLEAFDLSVLHDTASIAD